MTYQTGEGLAGVVLADSRAAVTCDGTFQNFSVIMASPPSWLDGAGNIIAPGLYVCGALIFSFTAPTTPGLYGQVGFSNATNDNATSPPLSLDALHIAQTALSLPVLALQSTWHLTEANLPVSTELFWVAQADATAGGQISPFVGQLVAI